MNTRTGIAVYLLTNTTLLILTSAASPLVRAQDSPGGSSGFKRQGNRDERVESGGGMGFMGGRGVEGTVTAATAAELTIKTELGETYKVQFNQNTHFMKDRQPAKSGDIRIGESIMAGGNIDTQAKTVGAAFVVTLDADQVKRIQEARASYGKTWLGGKITAIDETKITIAGADGKPAGILVDENTSFKKHKESITLADVKVGDAMTARGAARGGTFVATEFQVMERRGDRGPNSGPPNIGPDGRAGDQQGGAVPPTGPNR